MTQYPLDFVICLSVVTLFIIISRFEKRCKQEKELFEKVDAYLHINSNK